LKQQLFEQAITLVANEDHLLPLKNIDAHQLAYLAIVKQPITQEDNKPTPIRELGRCLASNFVNMRICLVLS